MPSDIDLVLNREFTSTKLTPDEVRAIRELVMDRLMTPQMAIEKLIAGGYLSGEAEEIIGMIESMPLPVAVNGVQ